MRERCRQREGSGDIYCVLSIIRGGSGGHLLRVRCHQRRERGYFYA